MPADDNFVEASIYLTPPGDGLESDEDSDTEEGSSANQLSSCQLTAPSTVVLRILIEVLCFPIGEYVYDHTTPIAALHSIIDKHVHNC